MLLIINKFPMDNAFLILGKIHLHAAYHPVCCDDEYLDKALGHAFVTNNTYAKAATEISPLCSIPCYCLAGFRIQFVSCSQSNITKWFEYVLVLGKAILSSGSIKLTDQDEQPTGADCSL